MLRNFKNKCNKKEYIKRNNYKTQLEERVN